MEDDSTQDTNFQYPDALKNFDDVDLNSSASRLDRDVKDESAESSNKTKPNTLYQLFQQITKHTPLPENSTDNTMEDKTESGIQEDCTCKQCCIL